MKPFIENYAYIPIAKLKTSVAETKNILTVVPKVFDGEQKDPILLYDTSKEGYLGVPLDWGVQLYGDLEFEDKTSMGNGVLINAPKEVDPNHPKAPKGQETFIKNIISKLEEDYCCFAVAQTGSGKTCSALAAASHFNVRTLVVVDRDELANQWIDEIHNKLGVPKSRIAKIRGTQSYNMDAPFCVGIVHSLSSGKFPDKFYKSFGMTIVDEAHMISATTFSRFLNKIYSTYRIAMTATPQRSDRTEEVFFKNLGRPSVISSAETLPVTVYVKRYQASRQLYGSKAPFHIKQIIKDPERNKRIVSTILDFYKKDRNALIVSDRIEHLEELMERCENLGIPKHKMGLYTGQKTVNGKRVTVKSPELKKVKETAQIIFSTYGMCEKGMDIPRLDAGMDVTPRAKATQLLGRVRRLKAGKKKPIWVTIVDSSSSIFYGYYWSRMKDYHKIKARIIEK